MRITSATVAGFSRSLRALGATVGTAVLLTGCADAGKTAPAPAVRGVQAFDGPLSPAEQSRIRALQAGVTAKLASGYVVKMTGTAMSAVVRADGKSTVLMGSSNSVQISLVPKSEGGNRIVLTGAEGREPRANMPACQDSCGNNGGAATTPAPQPSPPPNYRGCLAAGGATWYENLTGNGGCLGPGGSRPMTCGVWSYSSPGKGKFTPFGGDGITFDGVDWISDNGDGTCRVN